MPEMTCGQELALSAEVPERLGELMRHVAVNLPPAPHDPARFDSFEFRRWMREKIRMQRAFAALISHHAAASEAALADIESA